MAFLLAVLLQDLPSRALPAHPQKTTQVRLSPDGKLVLTLGEPDRAVKVWRLDTGKVLHTLGERAASFALRPDGGLVAVGGESGTTVWNLVTGEAVRSLDIPRAIALGWSRDGKTLTTVAIQRGGNKPGGLVAAIEDRKPIFIPLARDPAWAVVSPDGLRVAVPHESQVRVWDVVNDKVAYEVPGRAAAFSPDGKTLATAGDKVVRLWEGAKELRTLEAVYENNPCVDFSPDGAALLVGADTGIEIWEGGRRRPVAYAGPGTGLYYPASMSLSADGRTLAAGGSLILKNAPASGRVTGPLHFWKVR
jgi:WD40 repeat protein